MFLDIFKEDAFLVMPGSSPKWTKHLHIKLLLNNTLVCFCKLGMDFFLVSYLWSFFPLFLLNISNNSSGSILLLIWYPNLRNLCHTSSGKGMMAFFQNISFLVLFCYDFLYEFNTALLDFEYLTFYLCLMSYFPILWVHMSGDCIYVHNKCFLILELVWYYNC